METNKRVSSVPLQEKEKEQEVETDIEKEKKETEKEVEETDTETDEETDEGKEPELSWFQRIKNDFKTKGKFPKIDPLGFLPPFPSLAAMQAMASLNKIFQENIIKVKDYANVYMDNEIAKKKHNLELIDSLAEATKQSNLDHKVDGYVDHVLQSN